MDIKNAIKNAQHDNLIAPDSVLMEMTRLYARGDSRHAIALHYFKQMKEEDQRPEVFEAVMALLLFLESGTLDNSYSQKQQRVLCHLLIVVFATIDQQISTSSGHLSYERSFGEHVPIS